MTILLSLGGLYALASFPLCPHGAQAPPTLLFSQQSRAPLEVGAAKAEMLVPHWPATVAGYGPPRAEATGQTLPLYARAIALKSADFELNLLSVDALLVSEAFTEKLKREVGEVLVVPTHSHSALGGFDERWQVQVAATGRFDEAQHAAVLNACLQAIQEAKQRRQAARFSWEESRLEGLTQPRSGKFVDRRLLRLSWEDKGGTPIAQLLLLAAHPTLVRAAATQLNPDYPGELALLEENAGSGTTLVWPSAVGNARIVFPGATPKTFAQALHNHLQAWPRKGGASREEGSEAEEGEAPPGMRHMRIRFALPRVDFSRLVPTMLRGPANNLLCTGIAPEAELSLLSLGTLQLIAVPFEVSAEAALELEQAGLGRSLSIANNYLGYLETAANVEEGTGESALQYFDKTLLARMEQAAKAHANESSFLLSGGGRAALKNFSFCPAGGCQ